MKIVCWNVNGFRAVMTKGFEDIFESLNADIFCLNETKLQPSQVTFSPAGYYSYWSSAQRPGYSGTAVFTRREPISVSYGIDGKYSDEGRVITLELDELYLVCAYVPNAGEELRRLDYRMEFEDDMRAYLTRLDAVKPVVYCGDMNVAHNEIDLKNPKTNVGNAGFTPEERSKMTELLEAGFTDAYRFLYPERVEYSWWSYRFKSRERNVGWRLDYFILSDRLRDRVGRVEILTDILGSDHCPIMLEM